MPKSIFEGEDLNATWARATELMLHKYTEFLNLWHEAEGDTELDADGNEVPTRVKRADYYAVKGDKPRVLGGAQYGNYFVVHLRCSPYHDEGGPTILTGFLGSLWGLEAMTLELLIQDFEDVRAIWTGDHFENDYLPRKD